MKRSNPRERYGELVSILLSAGVVQEKDVQYAQRVQEKLSSSQSLLNVLKDLDLVTEETVHQTIQKTQKTIKIGELLVELGYLTPDDLTNAMVIKQEKEKDLKIGEVLVKYNFIDGSLLNRVLSIQLGYPLVQADLRAVDRELAGRVSVKIMSEHLFLPIKTRDGARIVAFSDPLNKEALQIARRLFGKDLVQGICDSKSLKETLRLLKKESDASGRIKVDSNSAIGIVNTMIMDAAQADASDIHIEPLVDRLNVRFRQDGVLVHYHEYPADIIPQLASRLKIMAKADIAEKRRHQGGRFIFDTPEGQIDMRVSFYVTIHGEKIVLRLLKQKQELLDIHSLGIAPRMLNRFLDEAVYQPSGVLLVTGPTGSGKTSTVYSCLHHIKNPQISIITAEEPVEYVIEGVAQCSIDPAIGVTFEETLRHIVRQDPDIIMIGEIRDKFSAEMAVQAALTGHKVLSTFHTEDSIGGLIRLLNMDIAPFLVSSTVVSVLAQRLLRKVCQNCAAPVGATPAQLQRLGSSEHDLAGLRFVKGRGCAHCSQTGYRGRIGVFELLVLDGLVRDAILSRRTSYEIRSISLEHSGLVTLMEDGLVKAAAGLTTIDEVLRCLPKLSPPRPLGQIQRLSGMLE